MHPAGLYYTWTQACQSMRVEIASSIPHRPSGRPSGSTAGSQVDTDKSSLAELVKGKRGSHSIRNYQFVKLMFVP